MQNKIRKVSIGPDYKNAMHFSVGQEVLKDSHVISAIRLSSAQTSIQVQVLIKNGSNEVYPWKTFIGMPFSVEYDIDFENEGNS